MIFKLLLLSLNLTTSALAYVPPSFYIVRHIAKKHADLTNVSIKTRISFLNSSGGTRGEALIEQLSIGSDGLINVSIKNSAGVVVAQSVKKLSNSSEKVPFLYDLVLNSDSSSLYTHAKSVGLNLKTENELYQNKGPSEALPYEAESNVMLEKEGKHVSLTLGSSSKPGKHAPKLWLDKSSLLLQKALYHAHSGDLLNVHFKGYAIHNSSFYPRSMEISLGETPWVKLDLIEIKAGTAKLSTQESEKVSDNTPLSNELENYLGWIR